MLVARTALRVDDAEKLRHGPEVDAWVVKRALHCVRLARPRLPIRKHADVVSAPHTTVGCAQAVLGISCQTEQPFNDDGQS
jgi:hypothetical protein